MERPSADLMEKHPKYPALFEALQQLRVRFPSARDDQLLMFMLLDADNQRAARWERLCDILDDKDWTLSDVLTQEVDGVPHVQELQETGSVAAQVGDKQLIFVLDVEGL